MRARARVRARVRVRVRVKVRVRLRVRANRAWRLAGRGLAPVHLQRPQLVEQAGLAPPAEDEPAWG